MIEDKVKDKRASWLSIKSSFLADRDYLDEIGVDEDLKREIRNG